MSKLPYVCDDVSTYCVVFPFAAIVVRPITEFSLYRSMTLDLLIVPQVPEHPYCQQARATHDKIDNRGIPDSSRMSLRSSCRRWSEIEVIVS